MSACCELCDVVVVCCFSLSLWLRRVREGGVAYHTTLTHSAEKKVDGHCLVEGDDGEPISVGELRGDELECLFHQMDVVLHASTLIYNSHNIYRSPVVVRVLWCVEVMCCSTGRVPDFVGEGSGFQGDHHKQFFSPVEGYLIVLTTYR